jgi:heterogeneous nuclear rnp K-like protein 2
VGSVIGKAGSKIKEIQEESSAKIVVSKDMLPQSTERIIEVFGVVDSM